MKKKSNYVAVFIGYLLMILPSILFAQKADNELTKEEKQNGWKLLFDGKSTEGWKTYQSKKVDSWEVVGGELHCKTEATSRADLITADEYKDFELEFDWKLDKGFNSGVMYHVTEDNEHTYESGPEYQLIDDKDYPDQITDKQKSGADYDMYAPSKFLAKPIGEYNHSRLIVKDAHVEHWLNGEKVVDFELWSPEWKTLKDNSKWKDVKAYGMAKKGHIAFQDHGGGVWFKNIKVRKL